MRNIHVTFASIDHNCFRKKLYQFNLKLAEELGLDPSRYISQPPKPSFGISNNSNEEVDENDENDQESMEDNDENNNEGEGVSMDHIMVLPSNHVLHDDDDDDNDDEDQSENDHYVIFLSFQN
jgi:hypothetical protein